MAKTKFHVFSARTTEEGLKAFNGLKEKLGASWDELVIEVVCGHYGMDKELMSLPKKEKAAKQVESVHQTSEQAVEERPAEQGEKKSVKKQRKSKVK